ncbi:MAG: lycopene cyclase family protein [Myxococcota bacterium]
MNPELLVLGSGPAGTALASALARRGRSVMLVDPAPGRPWPNRYGTWTDELTELGFTGVAARAWPRSEFVLPDGRTLDLPRGYTSIDGARLRAALTAGVDVPTLTGRVVGLDHDDHGTRARLADGTEIDAHVVVDATGHGTPFVRREGPPARAWQVAWGAEYRDVEVPFASDAMRFMDWRPHGPDDGDPQATFLYAMPMGDDRWFFEETQLIGPPMDLARLEARLTTRLARDGVTGTFDGGVERCSFPMDPPLPALDQPVLGFGAAASMVHPATGYLLARTLRAAPVVAEVLADGLAAGTPPRTVVRDAWAALWPADLLDTARLLQFGARTLLAMDREQIGEFYEAFFSIDEAGWRTYLAGDRPAGELARVMLEVFGASPMNTKLRLASQGLGDPWPLMRGVARMWI